MIVEQQGNMLSSEKPACSSDLDDLHRTLYDLGAQDLLDVWEAMESEVSDSHTCVLFVSMMLARAHIWRAYQSPEAIVIVKGGCGSCTFSSMESKYRLDVRRASCGRREQSRESEMRALLPYFFSIPSSRFRANAILFPPSFWRIRATFHAWKATEVEWESLFFFVLTSFH